MKRKQIKAKAFKPDPGNPATWPVIWRVVAPCCGSHDHDMVFIETDDEAQARATYKGARHGGHPVRIERVQVGPLPKDATTVLEVLRRANAQNPGTTMRAVPGAWSVKAEVGHD